MNKSSSNLLQASTGQDDFETEFLLPTQTAARAASTGQSHTLSNKFNFDHSKLNHGDKTLKKIDSDWLIYVLFHPTRTYGPPGLVARSSSKG